MFAQYGEQYIHLLIPCASDFAPNSKEISNFLIRLVEIDASPLNPNFQIAQISGPPRIGLSPLTGEQISVPRWKYNCLGAISEIPQLDNFDIVISGQGPPKLPPFQLFVEDPKNLKAGESKDTKSEFIENYSFIVRCCMRSQAVSMSHAAAELLEKKNTSSFGSPCNSPGHSGYFEHPAVEQLIEVPHAGCARFWIEFEFGKFLLPRITNTFAILASPIMNCAKEVFGIQFEQGCRW